MTDLIQFHVIPERPAVSKDASTEIDVAYSIETSLDQGGGGEAQSGLNLCLIIDRSGSMDGIKLEAAKSSALRILGSLKPSDTFTVLAFNNSVLSIADPQLPREQAANRINAITAGGGTNLSDGWRLGLLELQTYAGPSRLNRAILLSDGHATTGERKASVLGADSRRARDELNITTSTVGIGADFNASILSAIAEESGGNFWFIGDSSIDDIIRDEFGAMVSTALERPRVRLLLPPGLRVAQELHDLREIGGFYRVRPIRAGESFIFAQRLAINFDAANTDTFDLAAELYDGDRLAATSAAPLSISSLEVFAASPIDPRVEIAVAQYVTSKADEKMADAMEAGGAEVFTMLEAQSQVLTELKQKLTATKAQSWVDYTEEEKRRARERERQIERELAELQGSLLENKALMCVSQLIDLLRKEKLTHVARDLVLAAEKMGRMKSSRSKNKRSRYFGRDGDSYDDRAISRILQEAHDQMPYIQTAIPNRSEELLSILEQINEQLVHFS